MPKIALDYPATTIAENDDFKNDSLTGKSESDHCTNAMIVLKEKKPN